MTHELVAAFAAEQLALSERLCDMLNEQPQHRTERRGCGLTQATRLLSEHINNPRSATDTHDLSLFADFPQQLAATIAQRCVAAGWTQGWRQLDQAPAAIRADLADLPCVTNLIALPEKLRNISASLQLEESRLVMGLITDLLSSGCELSSHLDYMAVKPEIGSCSQAEEFFLEIAHGKIRRGGYVNLLVDAQRRPLLVEKMQLGESHSALIIEPLAIGGVSIPPGGLAALSHHQPEADDKNDKVRILSIDTIKEARFLRLTTLAVTPEHRQRAFSSQFKRQLDGNMLSPASTTLDDMRHFATSHVRQS